MNCVQCGEPIPGSPVKQGDEYYCSLECANIAAGYADEEESYFEEVDITESYREEYEE